MVSRQRLRQICDSPSSADSIIVRALAKKREPIDHLIGALVEPDAAQGRTRGRGESEKLIGRFPKADARIGPIWGREATPSLFC
jgi:hypothetical protein